MYKYFIHIISVILTSFYFFPFETVALPGVIWGTERNVY